MSPKKDFSGLKTKLLKGFGLTTLEVLILLKEIEDLQSSVLVLRNNVGSESEDGSGI